MTAKRTKEEREQDIQIEAEMRLKRYSYRQIAQYMNDNYGRTISHITVRKDVIQFLKRWKEDHEKEYDDRLNIELSKLDMREQTLWKAWEQSCKSSKGEFHGKGDPRYMDQIDKLCDRRCKLLGLYAPTKSEVGFENFRESELDVIINKLMSNENNQGSE